jgi:hypothetical protein
VQFRGPRATVAANFSGRRTIGLGGFGSGRDHPLQS